MERISSWLRLKYFKNVADLVVKVSGALALVTLITYAVARPSIKMDFNLAQPRHMPRDCPPVNQSPVSPTASRLSETLATTATPTEETRPIFRQALFDIELLSTFYQGAVPDGVLQTVREYNRLNLKDLACHVNSTERLLSPTELCQQRPAADVSNVAPPRALVEQVYDGAEGRQHFTCEAAQTVGDGFSYERMLLTRYYPTVSQGDLAVLTSRVREMQAALPHLRNSRYERADGTVWNEGSTRAMDIEIRAPVEFSVVREQDKKFSLNPREERTNIVLETKRGPVSERAITQPAFVNWSVDKSYVDLRWLRWFVLLTVLFVLALLVNDVVRHDEK